jgi:hypothetical protein
MTVLLAPISNLLQGFTNDGVPLNGGFVKFCIAGSFTAEQTTYTDNTGVTPNSNPIELDSSGRIPTNVWLVSGLAYNIILLAADESTVLGSVDNVVGVPTPGGSGAVTLTSTHIAFGSVANEVTSNAHLTYAPLTGALTVNEILSLPMPGDVLIKGAATDTGETNNGGFVNIIGGYSDSASGGDIRLTAGEGQYGGYVYISAGASLGADAGAVEVTGGYGATGNDTGGHVTIKGGDSLGGVAGNAKIYGGLGVTNGDVQIFTNNILTVHVTETQNVRIGVPSLATSATSGFPYFPTCAGVPIGVPTVIAGTAPVVIDITNNKMYFYSTGTNAWIALN